MEIDTETVVKIARLSRIRINEGESADIHDEFNFGKTNIEDMRKDSVTIYDNTDDIHKNTKNKNPDFFTVPKIVE